MELQSICNNQKVDFMHEHGGGTVTLEPGIRSIVLVGHPNVGKSVIFSRLCGKYVTVSNYPGTTVEVTRGENHLNGHCAVIDTPGVQTLIPRSEDERVARDILLQEGDKVVVQVGEAKNLRRALMMTSQLAEMGVPLVLDLNMWDEAQIKGMKVDTDSLSELLGVSVVRTVAVENQGMKELQGSLASARPAKLLVKYEPWIEEAIARLETLLPDMPIAKRSAAVMLLSGDRSLRDWMVAHTHESKTMEVIDQVVAETQEVRPDPLGYLINKQRLEALEAVVRAVTLTPPQRTSTWTDHLGWWSMHPVAGVPILLGVLFLLYKFVGEFGAGTVVDFVESVVFGEYINVWATRLFDLIPITLLQELMVGKYGLITMGLTYAFAIVLPIMTFFFLAFGIMEDSGYLPRLSIMTNRVFQVIGLNGKAVLPMVLGLGCDTMATMTTRILESRRERVIATLLLALGIPCSAQLGVILGMISGISMAATLVFVGVVASQLLVVGFLASKLIPGERSDFIVEIPPIRVPRLSNVVIKTLYRVEWFLREAVPLFLLGTLILFVADKLGVLAFIERATSPVVVQFLGLPSQATQSFLLGFLRRDYGAAGLFKLAIDGLMNVNQVVVSLVVITLFVPCIANFFVIIKERGLKTALAMTAFIFPFAILVGGLLNLALRILGVNL
jgi:ferrous iron transport protein B